MDFESHVAYINITCQRRMHDSDATHEYLVNYKKTSATLAWNDLQGSKRYMYADELASRDREPSLPSPQLSQPANMNASIERRETSSTTQHQNHIPHTTTRYNMPPKGSARVGAGRPAQSNSYVRNAINELSSAENRSVVVAVSFFAVSKPPSRYLVSSNIELERGGFVLGSTEEGVGRCILR